MINKNINTLFLTILIVATIAVFSRNFYNEILQKYLSNPNFFQIFFSDFYLIYAGSEILNQGNNPYKEWLDIHNSPFFNPPIVFHFFKFITNFEYLITVKFWFFFLFLSFISIPIVLFKIFKLNLKFFYIFLICFGGLTLSVFFTGNLSIILNGFFAISLFFLSKGKDHFFYLFLSILSLIKFPYLIFFGIPFLIRGLKKEVFINTFFYLIFITSLYLISFYQNSELFISWINSLEFSKFIGDKGDLGRGLFRILDNYFFSGSYLNYITYFLISGILFLFLIFLFKNSKILNNKKNKSLAIAFSIITLSIFLPRLKSYDVLITIPCLFFIIETLNFKISKSLDSLIKFLLFLMLFCWTSPYAPICLYSIIFIIFATDLKFNFIEKNL